MMLPVAIQRLFYRYHADLLDTDRHAAIIIPTVLSDGTFEDWRWLFQVYGWDTICHWISEEGHAAMLPPPMERFWTLILLGTPQETPRWAGGNARRIVPENALPTWFPDDLR
jgi:hypothetical protein